MFRSFALLSLVLVLSSPLRADILMNIPTYPAGDSKVFGYEGWYTVDSAAFSIDRELEESGEKGGTEDINIGVGEIDAVQLTKPTGAGSTNLFINAFNGNSIGVAEIHFVEVNSHSSIPYAAIKLDRTFVKSYSFNSDGGSTTDEFSFYFNRIAFATVVDAQFSVAGWDLTTQSQWTAHGLDANSLKGHEMPAMIGDFGWDGIVNGKDVLDWQRGLSPTALSAEDLADWESHFGMTMPSGGTGVPEPSSLALLAAGIIFAPRRR